MVQPGAFWNGRKYQLDEMTLRDLVKAYFAYPGDQPRRPRRAGGATA